SALRTDEFVESRGGGLAVDRDDECGRPGPRNAEPVEGSGEEAEDVLGVIREVVADARHAAVVGDDAAAVTVDQAADEVLGCLFQEPFLPGLQLDWPAVLEAGSVLREQARPVLGVEADVDAALGRITYPGVLSRHHSIDGRAAAINDARVFLIECDSQP